MIQGTIRFHRGVFRLPFRIQLFLLLLIAGNMLDPLYYLSHFEVKIILGTFAISATLMFALTGIFGFTRILGLGHILWVPLLLFIATRLTSLDSTLPFAQYLRLLIALNTVALIFDTVDVIRYLRGNRNEIVDGL